MTEGTLEPTTDDGRRPTTDDRRPTGDARRRNQIVLACVLAGVLGVLFLVLPALYRAHYEYLLWSEGFMERAFAKSFLSGHYEKLIETPKPLWNLFWLLAELPNRLYLLIVLMIVGVFLLFQLVSARLTRSIVPGLVASLVAVFGFKEVLILFLNGSWTVPYMLLGLLFLLALLTERWGWATVAIGLAGLVRPESWLLAVFMLVYIRYHGKGKDLSPKPEGLSKESRSNAEGPNIRTSPLGLRTSLRWYYFLPLAAPLLWALYDHRVSGDWLYSFRNTAAYAILTGVEGTNFLTFWLRLIPDIADATGIILLLYAAVGVVMRAVNIARETKRRKARAILLDPLLAVTWLPLIAAWILSVQGNLIIMRRFFYLSIGLLTLYALLAGWEIVRNRKLANRAAVAGIIALPIVLIALVRLPITIRDGLRDTKVTEAKMASIPELCEQLIAMSEVTPTPDDTHPRPLLDQYKYIVIPFRRYAQFTAFTNDSIARKFISYRELSLAVTSTQYAMMGEDVEPPAGSSQLVRDLMLSGKVFSDFLPALAVWIPDDEMHYIDAFSFDDKEYFHRNYIDHGRYGFRIVGSALDSLSLIYDVRDVQPGEFRVMAPPGEEAPPETLPRFQAEPGPAETP